MNTLFSTEAESTQIFRNGCKSSNTTTAVENHAKYCIWLDLHVHEKHVHSTLAKQENSDRIERNPPKWPTPYKHHIHKSRTLNTQPSELLLREFLCFLAIVCVLWSFADSCASPGPDEVLSRPGLPGGVEDLSHESRERGGRTDSQRGARETHKRVSWKSGATQYYNSTMYLLLSWVWLMIVQFRLATYEELYRKMKAQTVEDYRAALKEQVHCTWQVQYSIDLPLTGESYVYIICM